VPENKKHFFDMTVKERKESFKNLSEKLIRKKKREEITTVIGFVFLFFISIGAITFVGYFMYLVVVALQKYIGG